MIPLPSSNPSLLYKLFFPCLLLGINNFPGTSSYHHLEALFPCVFRHSHVSRCPPPSLSPDFQHYLSSSWLETPLGYLSPTANSVAETFKIYRLPLQISFLSRFLCACQPGSSPQGPPESSLCPGHISSPEWDWSLREGDSSQVPTKLLRSCHPWVSLPTLPEVPIGMANLVLCCQASSLWKQAFHSPQTPDYPTIQATELRGHSVNICLYFTVIVLAQAVFHSQVAVCTSHHPWSPDWAEHLLHVTSVGIYRNAMK